MIPEKVFISFETDRGTGFDNYYCVSENKFKNSVEYHLAPVWHDAKEPPEVGIYPVSWGDGMWSDAKYEFGEWFYWDSDGAKWCRFPEGREPKYYYPISQPPTGE